MRRPQPSGSTTIHDRAMTLTIRSAAPRDLDAIWRIECADAEVEGASRPGPDDVRAFWFGDGMTSFVAEQDGSVIGAYRLRAIRPGSGSHVGNATFLVDPPRRHRGVGTALAEHAVGEAGRTGFQALQFSFVPSTRTGSVALWRRLGFEVVGTLPASFCDPERGLVDAYVLHRVLRH
jgi:ribosomal protein S18 acetylase RimI-like enzyme